MATVHPRLRGELAFNDVDRLKNDRFIPAYAGNSLCRILENYSDTVHPRLRGELLHLRSTTVGRAGSSPLTRGTQLSLLPLLMPSRFIPAYAGNSRRKGPSCISYTVHPRLRGELHRLANLNHQNPGSSPLTRGTHTKKIYTNSEIRFIPAYAGNSMLVQTARGSESVHPRLRGELWRVNW